MIEILTWITLIAGGLLILIFLLSLLGGLDLDFDIGSPDIDAGGGVGMVKGVLTFVSISAGVMRTMLITEQHPGIAITIGIISGIIAFLILNYLFKLLLKNDQNVNWEMDDALFAKGDVYLKIPANSGNGIINVKIKGAIRELKAKSLNNKEIKTGEKIVIVAIDGNFAIVEKQNN